MPVIAIPTATEPLAVDSKTAATLLNSTVASLEKDRATGHMGIPYVKAGRRVVYRVMDLERWLASKCVRPLSQKSLVDSGRDCEDV